MSEFVEQETEFVPESGYEEVVIEIPVVEYVGDMYVCSACGAGLTEIPEYNRYYCQNCGLHY